MGKLLELQNRLDGKGRSGSAKLSGAKMKIL